MVYKRISIAVVFFLIEMSDAMDFTDQQLLERCGTTTEAPLLEFPFQVAHLMPIVIYKWNGEGIIYRMTAHKKSNLYALSDKEITCIENENFVFTTDFTIVTDPTDRSSMLAGALIIGTKDASLLCRLKCANLLRRYEKDKIKQENKK